MIEQVTFLNRQGVQLSGTIRHPSTDRKMPALIILHGFHQDRSHDLIAQIGNELGHYLLTLRFDFHAHGESFGEEYSMSEQVNDALAAISYIHDLPQVSDVFLFGHGVGGNVAIMAGHDARVKGVITQGAHSHLEKHKRLHETTPGNMSKGYVDDLRTIDVEEEAKSLNKPCLIIYGNDDLRVTYQEARQLFGWLSKGEWQEFDDADHWFREKREELIEVVREWIQGQ